MVIFLCDGRQVAFACSPEGCAWFVSRLCAPDCGWLAAYLLHCPDVMARAAFVHLAAAVVASLAPREADALLLPLQSAPAADTAATGGAVVATGGAGTRIGADVAMDDDGGGGIARLLARVLELMPEVVRHWRNADEVR